MLAKNQPNTAAALMVTVIAALAWSGPVVAQTVTVNQAGELIDAIQGTAQVIEVEGTIAFDTPFQETGNALPVLSNRDLVIRGATADAALVAGAPGFRLAEITGDVMVTFANLDIRGFDSPGDGGALLFHGEGDLIVEQVAFIGNRAAGHGGAVYGEGNVAIANPFFRAADSRFENNQAGGQGGAIYVRETASTLILDTNVFIGNQAGAGCAVTLHDASSTAVLASNAFLGPCSQALLHVVTEVGAPLLSHNTWLARGGNAYSFEVPEGEDAEAARLFGNLFAEAEQSPEPLCIFAAGSNGDSAAMQSFGFNIATDTSCELNGATDLTGVDPALVLEKPELPMPVPDGPAVDAIVAESIPATAFRCEASDINGLGRPQDGDGDGIFGCDIGAVEKQGGPDIGPAQTGAYFDPTRPGEGYFVEMLGGGRAWVTFFTYGIEGNNPQWFFAVGSVEGNSIVVDGFKAAIGPKFGEDFDPGAFQAFPVADLSLVFSTCQSVESPGRAFFDYSKFFRPLVEFPIPPPSRPFTDLLTRNVRLTSIVGCDGEPASAKSGLSGTFFAPGRSGEGIVVQWRDEDEVFAVWYTFDLDGRQLWMVSKSAEVEGNTVTLMMEYPKGTTGFGPNFDAAEIEMATWGTLTLEYTDCNTVEFTYDSVVAGFGSGHYTYTRLTQPAGTQCSL